MFQEEEKGRYEEMERMMQNAEIAVIICVYQAIKIIRFKNRSKIWNKSNIINRCVM